MLVYDNIVGEASRIGYGSAIGTILLLLALGSIITYLVQNFRREQRGRDDRAATSVDSRARRTSFLAHGRRSCGCSRSCTRSTPRCGPYEATAEHGYASIGGPLNFDNYQRGLDRRRPAALLPQLADRDRAGDLLTLVLASFVAFSVSRFSWRLNLAAADALHRGQPAARSR